MLSWLGFQINQWVVYAISAVLIIGMIFGGIFYFRYVTKEDAQLQFDNAQLRKELADKDQYIAEQKAINDAQIQAINDLNTQDTNLQNELKDLDAYLDSQQDGTGSSLILKTTVQKLIDAQKQSN